MSPFRFEIGFSQSASSGASAGLGDMIVKGGSASLSRAVGPGASASAESALSPWVWAGLAVAAVLAVLFVLQRRK